MDTGRTIFEKFIEKLAENPDFPDELIPKLNELYTEGNIGSKSHLKSIIEGEFHNDDQD